MATYSERATIRRDATLDPWVPGFTVPANTSQAAVEGAWTFVGRIQSAAEDAAYDILSAAAAMPEPPASGIERDQLMWAQSVAGGRPVSIEALRMMLAHFDQTPPAGFGNVTDPAIKTALQELIPVLAFGMRQGR